MKTYAITKTDNTLAIMTLIESSTVEQEINKWPESERNKISGWQEITASNLPADRTFRDAWRISNGEVTVDLARAKQIKMNQLRTLRDEKLKSLDIAYMRADEQGDETSKITIAARKQALRDLPTTETFEAVNTAEELASYVPNILL